MTPKIDNPYSAIFLLALLLIAIGIYQFGWVDTWTALQIPTMYPPYADMRSVQGALLSLAQGNDPQLANPGDPWGRPMNYPMIWAHIGSLLSFDKEGMFLGFVTLTLLGYITACYLLLRKYPSAWLLLAMLSGSSLLAMERGNNDLVVFTLCYLMAVLPAAWIVVTLVVAAAALKVYPAFSAAVLYKNKWAMLAATLSITAVFAFNYSELEKIRASTPVSMSLSYGAPSIAVLFKALAQTDIAPLAINLVLVTLAACIAAIKPISRLLKTGPVHQTERRLFIVGASLYLSTFILSSNWDYRLIFLLFCMPYCLHLLNAIVRHGVLALIVIASNQVILANLADVPGGVFNVICKAVLFSLILALLINETRMWWREKDSHPTAPAQL